jgi:SAM-dependent methyltransferase
MAEWYSSGAEIGRLERTNPLEFERTRQILAERLPPVGRVLDVGGGPGTYASWLAGRGYDVALVDPIELHVAVARDLAARGPAFEVTVGDARRLPFPDARADAVVMMGPLFHLTEPADRAAALAEAFRALRTGGVLAASAMGRFFRFGHAVAADTVRDPAVLAGEVAMATTGLRAPGVGPFPAYAHRPEDLRAEVSAAGFTRIEILAIEGFFHLLGDLPRRLADPASRHALFELLHRFEADPAVTGFSGHLMAVATRP